MIEKLITWGSWLVAGILLVFTARRWLFILFALMPSKKQSKQSGVHQVILPPVLLLVPVRNEAESLPALLAALNKLIYPDRQLTVVFINDGSTDSSKAILQRCILTRDNWHLCSLPQNAGKARALNLALDEFSTGDIVVVYDADERPQPDALQRLVQSFTDSRVGAASGRRAVINALASPPASYTAFEGLVHQLITMRAKDRLNLAPALLGSNCAYRRTALAQVGNFKPGALLEDSDLTLKLTRAGWKTHFEPAAVSYHRVPETVSGYWKQHTRWARGFNEVAKDQARTLFLDRKLSLLLRLELVTFSLGYLDRLALLVGVGLVLVKRRFVAGLVLLSVLTPFLQVMAALKIAQQPVRMWVQIFWLPFFFVIDIAMTINGFWTTLHQTPQLWEERLTRR